MMSRHTLLSPLLRTFSGSRPAIQAWRGARCFATEVSTGSSSTHVPTVTADSDTSAPASVLPPNVLSESISAPTSEETGSSKAPRSQTESPTQNERKLVGVVVSAGKMQKTVKVRIPGQKFNKHLRKVRLSLFRSLVMTVVDTHIHLE